MTRTLTIVISLLGAMLITQKTEAQHAREFFGIMGNVAAAVDTFFRPGQMLVQQVAFGSDGSLKSVNCSLWRCYNGGYDEKKKISSFVLKSYRTYRDSLVISATNGDMIVVRKDEENITYKYIKAFSTAAEQLRIKKSAEATPASDWSKAKSGYESKSEYIRELGRKVRNHRTLFADTWPYDMSELVGPQSRGLGKMISIEIDIISPTCGVSIMQEILKAEFDRRGNVSRVTGWRNKVMYTRQCTYL